MYTVMELNTYKSGDKVQVLINNPQTNQEEWRDGEVITVRMIHPQKGGKPYPIVIVKTIRTYCKATPKYFYVDKIPIFDHNHLKFYDKENIEGFVFKNKIRIK